MFIKTQKLVTDSVTGEDEFISFYFETTQIESLTPFIANGVEYTAVVFKSGYDCIY